MLQQLEVGDEEETITTEDGELMRLERRDGKRVAVRTKGKGKGKGKDTECFRCGRLGHMARDCTWATHVNGGKPRPAPQKNAHSLETEEPAPAGGGLPHQPKTVETSAIQPIGGLNIVLAALEPVDSSDDDEDDDPWGVPGLDPWARHAATSDISDDDLACVPYDPRRPTMGDLKAARSVPLCPHCEKAGVYEKALRDIKLEDLGRPVLAARSPPQPLTPMPQGVPRQVELAACMPGAPRADELPRVRKPKLRELPTPKWAKTFGLSLSKCSETCCPRLLEENSVGCSNVGKGHTHLWGVSTQ